MSRLLRRDVLARARRALGVEHLVLLVHDASFPSRPDEDTGRGSPYTRGARDFLAWAADLGFTGVQLGPQGETSATNPSPYDGTMFAKSILSAALWPLAHDPTWEGILEPELLREILAGAPAARADGAGDTTRVDYDYAYAEHHRALTSAHARARAAGSGVWPRFLAFREANASWLERDARYEALAVRFGTEDWRSWPAAPAAVPPDDSVAERFAFGQFVVHAQHAELVAFADASDFRLFGDLAIGISHRDRYERAAVFLRDYVMGAPPSRTNPEGQPWGYPVFVPGAAEPRELLRSRVRKMLSEFHGLRIDHPHGLVCPWVYDVADPDPMAAVVRGARLFESPDLPDHPALARFSIARPSQIDRACEPFDEDRVKDLDEAQVDAYAERFRLVVEAAEAFGRSAQDIMLEVLSTCPYPLERVMRRYGIGRFRVTQKADPRNPDDVYLTDKATRGDWVMLGNHDTPPIWHCALLWQESGKAEAVRAYLDRRLAPADVDAAAVRRDARALAQPMFADLFACDAGYVAVFFADLLGSAEIYNRPGEVDARNWSLRAGNDFAAVHAARRAQGLALDVPLALAMALRARDHRNGTTLHQALVAELEALDTSPGAR